MWVGQRDAPPLPWLPSGCFPPDSILHFPVAPSSSHTDPRVPASGLSAVCCRLPSRSPRWAHSALGSCSPPVTGPFAQLAFRDTPNLQSSGSPVAVIFPRPKGRPSSAALEALVPSLLSHRGRNWQMCHLLLGHQESESKSEARSAPLVSPASASPPCFVLKIYIWFHCVFFGTTNNL